MTEIQKQSIDSSQETQKQIDNKNYEKLINFLKNPEFKNIIEKYQVELDKKNKSTTWYIEKNIDHTRDNITWEFNLSFTSIQRERDPVKIEKWWWFNHYIKPEELNNDPNCDEISSLLGLCEIDKSNNLYIDDLSNAIDNQRTQKDIDKNEIIVGIFWLWELSPEDRKTISPLDILRDNYKNASENDKIKLAQVMSRYMNDFWYDHNATNWRVSDVSSEDMWAAYKEWWVAWVCRHHHSEVAKFLKSVWFETWIVTTNSWWRHAVTWWKKQDWSFFMIDYWSYYEWKDPKELKAKYLAWKWALDLKETICDENWNTIWIIQTDLEKLFENTTSSIWTWDSLDFSKDIAKNWIKIHDGHDIDISSDSEKSIKVDYNYGNWSIDWWVFFHKNTNTDYADYTSYWIKWNWKIWDRTETFWELSLWWSLSHNKFEWQTDKSRELIVRWVNINYSKELFNNWTTEVWLWWVIQWQLMYDIKNAHEEWKNWIEDGTWNFWTSLDIKHRFNDNLDWYLNLWYGWDILNENIRSFENDWFKIYDKKSIDVWWEYKTEDWDKIWVDLSYEEWLAYNKKWADVSLESWNLTFNAWVEETDNSKNPFLLSEAKKHVWIKYNVTDTLNIYSSYENISNWINTDNKYNVWINYKF